MARSGRRMYGRWWTTLKTCKFTTRRDASADPQLFAGVCASSWHVTSGMQPSIRGKPGSETDGGSVETITPDLSAFSR